MNTDNRALSKSFSSTFDTELTWADVLKLEDEYFDNKG